MMIENKKSSILLVLKVLEEYSDENHFLTQQEIIDKIYQLYNISLERKSIAFSISLLQELDYDINKSSKGGYALLQRNLDHTEIRFIIDSLLSCKSLTNKQVMNLINKVNSCLSKYQRRDYNYIYRCNDINKNSLNDIFYTLELINESIEKSKRISFQYLTYDENGKKCLKNNGYRYIVSPYYTVNNNGRYYLICNYREKYHPLQIFRLDYITNPKIEEEWPLKKLKSLNGMEKFNISTYLNEHIYLLNGEVISSTILIENEYAIIHLKDWFDNARIYKKDNKIYADIICDENALFYWYMQYSECMKIISPQKLIDRIKKEAKNILDKYK